MAKCADHIDGKTPMFLKYTMCDDCANIYHYRVKTAGQRKARLTRANRATATINDQPATAAVRKLHASKLPRTDPWYRPIRKGGAK